MFATYQRLGVPVSASSREVIKAASRKLAKAAFTREHRTFRHDFYRAMLKHHDAAWRVAFFVR